MNDQVLVVYASKYGATEEIAEKIGETLRQSGLHVDVLPADKVHDLTPYTAVVLGSAVYIGQWRKQAAKFLRSNQKALAERVVWLFSSGPAGDGDPLATLKGWRFPEALQPLADSIRPRDIAVFPGVINEARMNFLEKWMLKNMKVPAGDYRDWHAITAWSMKIAEALKGAG